MSSATHADPEQSDPTSEPDVSCDLPDHHHTDDDDDDDDEGSATGSPLSPAEAMQAAIAAGELSLSDVRSPRKASGNSRNLFLELESEDEGDTDAAAAAVAAAVKTCNHRGRTTRKLILSMTTMMLQYQITSQCDTQIWLNHYKGDFAAQARTTSLMMSLLMTGGFFCTPLIGAVSDCYGRKVQMILPPLMNFLQRLVLIYTQDVRALFASFVIGGTLASAGMGGWQAAIADLHAEDPAALASASSMMSMGPMLGGVIGPLVGGALASRDIRLPYAVSAAVCAVACGFVVAVPETLPTTARIPIVWRSAGNPLSFVVLFRNGVELAALTGIQLLSNLGQGSYSFSELYRTELLDWDMAQRGRYQSVSMLVSLPGTLLLLSAFNVLFRYL
jgi:MFS family permease